MITTTGSLLTNSNGNFTYSVTINVTLMTESFVSIVSENLFLNGSLLSSGTAKYFYYILFLHYILYKVLKNLIE